MVTGYLTQLFLVSTEELLAGVDDTELSKSTAQ